MWYTLAIITNYRGYLGPVLAISSPLTGLSAELEGEQTVLEYHVVFGC